MTNFQIPMTNESSVINQTNNKYNIRERALEFAARVACFVNALPKSRAAAEYRKQLIRTSASVGANLGEADGTLSKKDFANKIGIAHREARESRYWLLLMEKAELIKRPDTKSEARWLTNEAREIRLILSAIINETQGAKKF